MLTQKEIIELRIFAEKIRLETMKSIVTYGRGHVGGAVSMAEAMAVLYGKVMHYDVHDPRMEDRDRFVLSKGHAGPGLYATLALCGFYPMEELATLNQPYTILPSHCDMMRTPGVDMSSGSLGLGLSTAIGMAMASKIRNIPYHTYVMIGDGECDEGQIWEGFLMAAHQKLDCLTALIDYNKVQLDGPTDHVCALGDLTEKIRQFGWYVQSVDGHDVEQVYDALMRAKQHTGQPSAIMLNTVKGYGCPNALKEATCHALRYTSEKDIAAGKRDIEAIQGRIDELIAEGAKLQ